MNARPELYLAGQGYPIFLCVPGGKKPLTPRGFYDASADLAQVAEWWEKWLDANIGLPTGTITVLDIDPDKGGVASLQRLERDFESMPPTLKVATGSGGRHHYLEDATCSIRCSEGRLGPAFREVSKIAASIARYPAGKARPAATPEVHAVLDRVEAAVLAAQWAGLAGGTDRGVAVALIALARSYGTAVPAGVRVSISRRDLALLAGVRHAIVTTSVKRLRRSGWLTCFVRRERPIDLFARAYFSASVALFDVCPLPGAGRFV